MSEEHEKILTKVIEAKGDIRDVKDQLTSLSTSFYIHGICTTTMLACIIYLITHQ